MHHLCVRHPYRPSHHHQHNNKIIHLVLEIQLLYWKCFRFRRWTPTNVIIWRVARQLQYRRWSRKKRSNLRGRSRRKSRRHNNGMSSEELQGKKILLKNEQSDIPAESRTRSSVCGGSCPISIRKPVLHKTKLHIHTHLYYYYYLPTRSILAIDKVGATVTTTTVHIILYFYISPIKLWTIFLRAPWTVLL